MLPAWLSERIDPVRLALCLGAMMLATWLAIAASIPPAALPVSAPLQAFSAGRAMADVAAIGTRPHPTGSTENRRVAAYLAQRMESLGLLTEQRHYLIDDTSAARLKQWSGGTLSPSELTDIVGILPGRDRSQPALALMAHYDTVWGSPGAADDSAGVATVLETVRALETRGIPERDVIVLLTDAEEAGLGGAKAFWDGDALAKHIGVVVNFETRGAGGRATMFETGPGNGEMMRLYGRVVAHPVANSLATLVYRLMPNSTDYTVARAHDVAGFNFAFTGRAAYYHSPLAVPAVVDPRSVQDMGGQALDISAALAAAPLLPARTADTTFFDLLGGRLVRYAPGMGWLVLLAAGIALTGAWQRARPPLDGIAAGAGVTVWTSAIAVLLLGIVNRVSGAGAVGENYYDRLAALPRLEWQAALVLVATLIAGFSLRGAKVRLFAVLPPLLLALVARKLGAGGLVVWAPALVAAATGVALPRAGAGAWGGWIGLAALLLILAVAVQIALPEAAWLLAWPALVIAIALFAATLIGRTLPVLAIAAAGAVIAVAPALPLAHLAMLNVGAGLPEATVALLPILLAALWPLARMRANLVSRGVTLLCLVAALVIAVGVRRDPVSPTVPAYSLEKR